MADDPQDTGPEPAENKDAARDGEPRLKAIPGGDALADRADQAEEDDGQQAFVVEEAGKTVTHSQLLKRGVQTEVRYKATGKSLSNPTGGLLDPYATSILLVGDYVVDSIDHQYVRDDQGKVEKVIQYVTVKPRVIHPAKSEAARVMLSGLEEAQRAAEDAAAS